MEKISYRPPRLSLDHHADVRQSLEKPGPRSEGDVRLSVEFYHRATTTGEAIEQRAAAKRQDRPPPKVDKEYEDDVDNNLHRLPHDELFATMKTQPAAGLSDADVQARLKEYGPNLLTVQREQWLKAWFRYFFGGFGFLLWPAAILCILAWHPLGKPPDPINLGLGIIIFAVILLQAGFNAFQEHQSSKVMASIRSMLPSTARVTRNGSIQEVPAESLVPGDIVTLSVGGKVPADCVVFEVQELKIDNSALTGESVPVSASTSSTAENQFDSKNVLFMGTNVAEGTGRAVITRTGTRTTMGKIARLAAKTKDQGSRLSNEINQFLVIAASLALAFGALVMLIWVAWLRTSHKGFLTFSTALVVAIATVISFVPEGLPVGFTLSLAIVARRMAKSSVLVKQLSTVETLGSVDLIASDKTGTLTQNRMTVVNVYLPHGDANLAAEQCNIVHAAAKKDERLETLLQALTLCCGAVYGEEDAVSKERPVMGDATDAAVLRFTAQMWDVPARRAQSPQLAKLPFNSKNKYMITIHRVGENQVVVLLKGAAERILERCSDVISESGELIPMSAELRAAIATKQEQLGSEGQRVLGACQLLLTEAPFTGATYHFNMENRNFPTEKMTFLGLIGIMDPPRPEVKASIAACKGAGVRVTMVTGDHPTTAVAIARQIGIISLPDVETIAHFKPDAIPLKPLKTSSSTFKLNLADICSSGDKKQGDVEAGVPRYGEHIEKALVVTGTDIPMFDAHRWSWAFAHRELVFARTSPEQKLTIVKEAQKRDHSVAVTGDGINDSAALKQADVGVAMGSGSDVAREAAKLVLLTDNFSSVVYGIEQGRIFYDNLKKLCLFFLPAGCFSELLPNLFTVLFGLPLALSPFEMIYICIVTDLFPSLSLIYEKAESDLMRRPPRPKNDKLVDWKLLGHVFFFYGPIIAFASFFNFFFYMWHWGHLTPSQLFFSFEKFPTKDQNITNPVTNISAPITFHGQNYTALSNHLYTGQTTYFVTLVSVQFFCINAIRTRSRSLFQQPWWQGPTANWLLPLAVLGSLASLLIAVYVPFFNSVFHTRHVRWPLWLLPWAFGLMLLGLDEVRKMLARTFPESWIARCAW